MIELLAQVISEAENDSTLTPEEKDREIAALLAGEYVLEPEEILS
jgi:hypothetical protein